MREFLVLHRRRKHGGLSRLVDLVRRVERIVVDSAHDPECHSAGINTLQSVSCLTATFCMAVGWSVNGSYSPLTELWNGATWTIEGALEVSAAGINTR